MNIGRYDDSYLLAKAEELVIDKTRGSRVMDPEEEGRVPQFAPNGMLVQVVLPSCVTVDCWYSRNAYYR